MTGVPDLIFLSTAFLNCSSWYARMVLRTVIGPEQLALDPTALNSNLLPVNANGDVLFLSVLSTSSSGICGMPRLYPFFPVIFTMSLLARSWANASLTCLPRKEDMIAGGASLAPSLWALVALRTVAFRRALLS